MIQAKDAEVEDLRNRLMDLPPPSTAAPEPSPEVRQFCTCLVPCSSVPVAACATTAAGCMHWCNAFAHKVVPQSCARQGSRLLSRTTTGCSACRRCKLHILVRCGCMHWQLTLWLSQEHRAAMDKSAAEDMEGLKAFLAQYSLNDADPLGAHKLALEASVAKSSTASSRDDPSRRHLTLPAAANAEHRQLSPGGQAAA